MSKRILMLSTAAVALFTSAALADTTIDSTSGNKTTSYITAAKRSTDNSATVENAKNITIKTGYSVTVSGLAQGAIIINDNHWFLNQGTLIAKDKDGVSAIQVDMSVNPDFTGTSITGLNSGGTASVTGIYLDSNSSTSVSGSGTGKTGIYLDTSSCSAVCTFKGDITVASSAVLSASGDGSSSAETVAIQLGKIGDTATKYGVIKGNVNIGGTVTASAESTGNSATYVAGLLSYGQIDGNLILGSGAQLTAYGHGALGMMISGQGVTGSVSINGALATSILNATTTNYYSKVNTTTNAEASSALLIGANIGAGIEIGGSSTLSSASSGSVSTRGQSPAIAISPSYGSMTQTSALTIGIYADSANPGFSFYNRGAVAADITNYNKPTTAIQFDGTSDTLPTTFTGGFYSSGTITASAQTSNDASTSTGLYAHGIVIGNYTKLLPNGGGKIDADASGPGDKAALVISGSTAVGGKVSASVSGTRGGTARAIYIASTTASVPSLINTGTITASATTTNASLSGNISSSSDPLAAYAIQDLSGTLQSIVNSGTIAAYAGYSASSSSQPTALDNDSQVAVAILLNNPTPSASTSIQNLAYNKQASIVGDIIFGSGNNQLLELKGNSSYASTVTGNVYFGNPDVSSGISSGDQLHIGSYGYLSGKVTTQATVPGSGVEVDIDTQGRLDLLNTDVELKATGVNVATGGTLNLGVNRSLTGKGMIQAQAVNFANGANLGVTYASFLPSTSGADTTGHKTYQFVLMSSDIGQMTINQSIIDTFNNAKDSYGNSTRPYLLKAGSMCNTGNGACGNFSKPDSTKDYLLIDVVAKTASELQLAPGSIATAVMPNITKGGSNTTTLFEQANLALAVDDTMGAMFINGIHNAKEAAKAYNDMAPGVTGGTRAIAISITDSATGPVAARQRALRMYGKTGGDFTIWGQEFVQMIKDPGTGATDANTGFKTNPGFKDHGFGMAVGLDGGSPKYGWYGGALTFYAGDVNELARSAHQNQQWYLLSLYSDWRGKGLFLDTKIDAGYGHIDGKRTLVLYPTSSSLFVRQADNKHAGALISGSVATGAMFSYGAATFMPQLNIDGMYLREEGYTEHNPTTSVACTGGTVTGVCDAMDLKVSQYYAKSLRAFVGLDVRYDLKLWDIYLQPEARAGYRYDFLSDPVKLKAAFAYSDVTSNHPAAGDTFEVTGPDPARGNFVLGGSLSTTTDTWTLGLNFDLVKGSNDAFQQVATLHILGRI